jgi:hypothetical protein
MSWPTTPVGVTNLDAGTDSPAAARADLKAAVDAVNAMIGMGDPFALHGRLLAVRKFTTGGTYTPTAGTSFVIVEAVGGGGGGGGAGVTGSGAIAAAGCGGGSGAMVRALVSSGFAGVALAIGAGGAGGSGNSTGSQGGDTTFGALVTAFGGYGGNGMSASSSVKFTTGGGWAGGAAVSGSAVLLNFESENGTPGQVSAGCGCAGIGGRSELSPFLANVGSPLSGGPSGAPIRPGAGGGGALSMNGGAAQTGGIGAAGQIIIHEYA